MTSRGKAWMAVVAVVGVLAMGIAATVLVFRTVAERVPGNSLLTIDVAGPIAERSPDSPLAGVFGGRALSLEDLRAGLLRAAADSRVRGVRLRISDFTAGFATIQEIRSLVGRVNDAGKTTSAYLETAGEFAPGNMQYLLASACKRVVVSPLGDVNLTGLAITTPFIRGTLDKLGIEPDFPGIGDYKTARFFYTERGFTPADREMMTWLLDSFKAQFIEGIAASRHMEIDRARQLFLGGPYLGPEAVTNQLIDELADWETFVEESRREGKSNLEEVSLRQYLRSGRPDESGTPIAVVIAEGTIVRGDSGYSPLPLFGGDMMGSSTLARAWRDVRDSGAKAVIFRVNSPGGSPVASEVIRAEMARTAKKIPVVVSMSDVAASGGYWITCGAQRVVADPGTITASIGVFGGHFAMSHFWEDKLGVTWGRVEGAPNADIFGTLDPWTPSQKATVGKFLDRIYGAFLDRVASSRHMTREQVDAVGRGRVFTGEQAKERGLVDELGGFDSALAAARRLAGLAPDAPVELRYYPRTRSFWQRALERAEDSRALAGIVRALGAPTEVVTGPVWVPPIIVR
ncbi:MAG: S49 family peptidase [Acidobacteriota bacterium]